VPEPTTPFHDLRYYVALPRLTGLVLSPDGRRLVASLQQLAPDGDRYQTSLWDIDPAGMADSRRLTHSEQGESGPAFVGDGSLLFTSKRPGSGDDSPDEPALWRLPERGEATRVATSAGGLFGPLGAQASSVYVIAAPRLADATEQDDAQWRGDRKDAKVTAIIHAGFPIRRWDHELGPDFPRLLLARTDDEAPPRDLAPDAGAALTEAQYCLAPDGTTVVTTWSVREPRGRARTSLVAIDVATGTRRTVADESGVNHAGPVIAPDGSRVAALRVDLGSFNTPARATLCVHELAAAGSRSYDLTDTFAVSEYAWAPDASTLYVAGDRQGRGAIVALDTTTGDHRRIASDAVYTNLSVSPDGTAVYALRSAVDCPPQPVSLDTRTTDGTPTFLPSPAPRPDLPGTLVEVEAAAPDGAPVHGWLVLPDDTTQPAPLQQWIHGGPFGSYNSWSWRWCPWIAAARGWAVLMPDPALSTGYGQEWIARAWPHRAALVWRDVEALLDVVAIVSHSGIWAADQEHTTTDIADWKTRMIGTPAEHPDWYAENSPHRFADAISTPMLVIHGNRDYRVPYAESLRLFWDLVSRHDGDPESLPHRFLEFPGENHWVLSPSNARIWNETVLAFLEWHVLGGKWSPPRLA
jgi:dipeptidyl aminopeptidase/acylaminoacyl peptidase